MTTLPTVSVIIPLYNKAPYVERAVRSVLTQTAPPYEVLVVDDGSTDDGAARLSTVASDHRIRIIRQTNAGEGAARNRGLSEMRGDLAAFLDADDEWLPGHLEHLLELAVRFPEAGILATGFRTLCQRGVALDTTITDDAPALISDYFEMARGSYLVHISSCAVRRAIVEESGDFAESEPLGADLEFIARVCLRRPVAYHPAITGQYYAGLIDSATDAHSWSPNWPPVVRLLRSPNINSALPSRLASSAAAYADWILTEHAITGIARGYQTASALLAQVQPRYASTYGSWISLAARYLPMVAIRFWVRLRRSRIAVAASSPRNRVVQRVFYANA